MLNLMTIIIFLLLIFLVFIKQLFNRKNQQSSQLSEQIEIENEQLKERLSAIKEALNIRSDYLNNAINAHRQATQQESQKNITFVQQTNEQLKETIYHFQQNSTKSQNEQFFQLQQLIANQLQQQSGSVAQSITQLAEKTSENLNKISSKVDEKLEKSLSSTQSTFSAIQNRLTVIDQAQKNMDSLSHNITDLTHILSDKKARGAFGEVQLQTIIENALPKQFVSFQHTLPNSKRADCVIHLPEPNGDIAIDAKFPLESYKKIIDNSTKTAANIQQFKADIKKHISDIADKYILPPETAESAILFLPAEAIFAEIHANYPDLIAFAQQKQVWITSPTTLMAVLATAKTVIKDDVARRQSKVIREQLHLLGKDFERFQARMDSLAKSIEKANESVSQVNISANKISNQFKKIETSQFGEN